MKKSLEYQLTELPKGTTIKRVYVMFCEEKAPRLRWEISHPKITLFVIRDRIADAVKSFNTAIDERGLRPFLDFNNP